MDVRIPKLVRQMIIQISLVTEISASENEFYFLYKGKFFSILKRTQSNPIYGDFSFYCYPKWNDNLDQLVKIASSLDADDIMMIDAHEQFLDPSEKNLFKDLYSSIKNKFFGVDDFFDDLLNN